AAPTLREGRPDLPPPADDAPPRRATARDRYVGEGSDGTADDPSAALYAREREVQPPGEWLAEGEPPDAGTISDTQAGTGADRLRRRDFDAFERALLRRRRLGALGVPIALAVAAGLLAFAVLHSKEKAAVAEQEPNDSPAQATLLPL